MSIKGKRFIEKKIVDSSKIMYIDRENGKTSIHLYGGMVASTFIPIKALMEELPGDIFISINKGMCVNRTFVESIDSGVYKMQDGKELPGRVRTRGKHYQNWLEIVYSKAEASDETKSLFSPFDDLPAAYCGMEVVYDKNNTVRDLIFRYSNKSMEDLLGLPAAKVVGLSYFDVFNGPDVGTTWLNTCQSITSTGEGKVFDHHCHILDKQFRFYGYQVTDNMCGCMLVEL